MKATTKNRLLNSSGVTIVLTAIFIAALVMIVGLVVFIGWRSNSVSKFQSVANLAVQAGLNEFSRTDPALASTPPSQGDYYLYKADRAIERINAVLADSDNSVLGLGTLGQVGHANNPGSGGYVELGMWYDSKPANSDPCGQGQTHYPCFIRNPVPQSGMWSPLQVNAMRVYLRNNPNSNPFVAPFSRLFGGGGTGIETVATSAVIPRAVYVGIDASGSSFYGSHIQEGTVTYKPNNCVAGLPVACSQDASKPPGDPSRCLKWCEVVVGKTNRCNKDGVMSNGLNTTTDQTSDDIDWCLHGPGGPNEDIDDIRTQILPSLFVIEYAKTRNKNDPSQEVNCADDSTWVVDEQVPFWCNMDPVRPVGIPVGNLSADQRKKHYRSDFVRRTINVQGGGTLDLMVDSFMAPGVNPPYRGPEPLSSLLLATNGALRLMSDSSANDSAKIAAFDGRLKGSFPRQGAASKLATDLGPLIQISNVYNMGPIQGLDEAGAKIAFPDPYNIIHYPNFLDLQLFSIRRVGMTTEGQSNIIETLRDAMDSLSEADPKARKLVFLMTDFISSCKQASPTTYDCLSPGAAGAYDNYFSEARQQLFGSDSGGQISDGLGGLVGELIRNKIAVSVIQAGKGLGLNYKNELFTFADGVTPPRWLSPLEAAANGRGGPYTAQGDPTKLFYNLLPNPIGTPNPNPTQLHDANVYAYDNFGGSLPNNKEIQFREPIGLAADLAIKTGGAHCMLMEPCLPGYYVNGKIYDGCRPVPADNTDPNLMEFDCDGDGDQEHLSCAPENKSIGQQAAECIMNVLLSDPFQLVSEGPMSPATPTPLATLVPTSTSAPTLTPTRTPTGMATNTPTRTPTVVFTPTRTATPGGGPPPPPPSKGDPDPDGIIGVE